MTYGERERELAMSVLVDPESTAEDRTAARARLRDSTSTTINEDNFEALESFELQLFTDVYRKLHNEPAERLDAYQARRVATNARQWADHVEATATGAAPPAFVPTCKRCSEFSDDNLDALREVIAEEESEDAIEETNQTINPKEAIGTR